MCATKLEVIASQSFGHEVAVVVRVLDGEPAIGHEVVSEQTDARYAIISLGFGSAAAYADGRRGLLLSCENRQWPRSGERLLEHC